MKPGKSGISNRRYFSDYNSNQKRIDKSSLNRTKIRNKMNHLLYKENQISPVIFVDFKVRFIVILDQ